MKKLLLLFIGLLFWAGSSWGQVSDYAFASSVGTYTPLSAETILWSGTFDDQSSTAITIPGFTLDGTAYTTMFVQADGWITLGGTSIASSYFPISQTTSYPVVISAFGRDLNNGGSGNPKISYNTNDGGDIVVQYQDVRRRYQVGELISFQIRLVPSTGAIKFIYGGTITGGTGIVYPEVGLRGPTNSIYNNRTTITDWAATTAGTSNNATCLYNETVLPSIGLTFTFTPPLTPPFTQTFITYPPDNWTKAEGLLAEPVAFSSILSGWNQDGFANVGATGAARLNIYGDVRQEWMITPPINLGNGTTDYRLTFDLALTAWNSTGVPGITGTDDKFAVVISTDNGATWTSANTLMLWDNAESANVFNNISNTGENVVIDLSTCTGTVKLGFYGESTVTNADNDLFVDNVTVEQITCPTPTALTVSNITTTTAKLSWAQTGSATWNIKWGLSGFNPASGGTTIPNVTSNFYNLSTLMENTTYDWYVQAACSVGDKSFWAGPGTFSTRCGPVSIPYYENFNAVTAPALPNCMSMTDANTDGITWRTAVLGIGSTNAAIIGYNTEMAMNDWLFTAGLQLEANKTYELEFFYAGYKDYVEKLAVYWGIAPQVASMTGGPIIDLSFGDTRWQKATAIIRPTSAGVYYIGFNGYSDMDQVAILIDNISIYVPTCPTPSALTVSGLTTSSANLGWTENGSANLWNIKWGESGFNPGTEGTLISGVSSNSYTFSGLTENTTYDWYVQADCGGEQSNWAGPETFTTLCEPASVPYLEKFDAPANSSCVTIQDLNGANTWKVTEGSGYTSHSLPNSIIYDYSATTAADDWFFIQGLNLSVDKTYTLKFYYKGSYGPVTLENLEVNYGTAPDAASMTSGILFEKIGIKSKFDDPFEVALVNFTPPSTGVYYIGFHCFSLADQASLYIDDISIDEIFCPAPEALTVSDLTISSASLGWSQIGIATTAWNIKWGSPGFDPATEGTLISGVETKSYTLSGLVASTAYSWYVQAACGGVNQSFWTGPKTFTTLCNGSVPIPYFENFDAATLPALPNCMSRIDANGDDITWVTDHFGYSAPNSALIIRNPALAMDDWLFTAGLQLEVGKTYELGYVYSLYSYIENLAVYWGSAAQVESMAQLVITSDQTLNDAGWRLASVTISPPVSGVYYIGFKGYSPADQFVITIDDIYVIEKVANATWSGAADKNWYNTQNWADGKIPCSSTDVVIPAGVTRYPTIRSAANCNNITLQSNASGTASLLGNNRLIVNGTATVERYLPGGSNAWHLLSSPVANQAISGNFIPAETSYDFYAWDEPTAIWLNQKVVGNGITQFVPGKGYLIAYELPNTKSFTGNLNNGEVQFALSRMGAGNYIGSNLMGNPYPSGIDWNLVTKFQFIDNYAYAYNPLKSGGEGYVQIGGVSAVKYIGVGQGFMVLVAPLYDGTLFKFTNAMRSHGGSFYKNTEATDELKVRFANATNYDETSIRLSQESEFIRDRNDAVKMFSYNPAIPQVYTLTSDLVNASINAIPSISEEAVFPLCLYVPAEDNYVISLPVAEGEFAGRTVYLEDKLTGSVVNLSNSQTYSFAASPSDNTNRFILKFSTLGIDKPTVTDGVQVYANDDILYIATSSKEAALVNVYNLTGQLVMQGKTGGNTLTTLNASALSNGVYVVSVILNKGVVSQKVVIRK